MMMTEKLTLGGETAFIHGYGIKKRDEVLYTKVLLKSVLIHDQVLCSSQIIYLSIFLVVQFPTWDAHCAQIYPHTEP